MLSQLPLPASAFHACKMLSNCLCAKALRGKRFQSSRVPPQQKGSWKNRRWDTNSSQPGSLGQRQDVFSSCSLEDGDNLNALYSTSLTTALLGWLLCSAQTALLLCDSPTATPSLSFVWQLFCITGTKLAGRAQQQPKRADIGVARPMLNSSPDLPPHTGEAHPIHCKQQCKVVPTESSLSLWDYAKLFLRVTLICKMELN